MMYIIFLIVALNFSQVITDNNDMEGRVVNGQLAKIQRHPHSVYLFVSSNDSTQASTCGGSIVNQRVVLTAAHCFEQTSRSARITATMGSSHIGRGRTILATSVRVHPQYDSFLIVNDIALVGLKYPIVFGLKAKRIVIAKKKPTEGMAKMAGWGAVKDFPDYMTCTDSDYLHVVSVPFMSREKCKNILNENINNGTFCGGKLHAKSYPAVGDSGSALVFKNHIQIGLVSYKIRNKSKSVIIYTDVPYFYNWIVENTKSVFCKNEFHLPT
ncbi:trypsin-like [Maniola hyperantus]|uniref:trypsin-like n=1 Tax=Aphantopus hyperantus TaxID=2795564 RepID=UPI0015681D20|nr:trypsin-like [Maniola hyperantus]